MSFAPLESVPARGVILTDQPCSMMRATPRPSCRLAGDPGGSSSRATITAFAYLVLKRKLVSEKTKQLRDADGGDLVILGRKIARWVADHEDELRQYDSTVSPLDVDNDRAKDVWDPLLAIADTAGGEWPKRARAAGKALVAAAEEEDIKIVLLGDIRAIFRTAFPPEHAQHNETPENDEARSSGRYGPRMTSKELVGELLKLEACRPATSRRRWPPCSARMPLACRPRPSHG
jgi:hypothetical protein